MSIFERVLSTPEITDTLSDRSLMAALFRVLAALARAQATAGLMPEQAAASIAGTCKVELFDVLKLSRESAHQRCLTSPLVASLRETVALFNPQAAAFVGQGASAEDLAQTAVALLAQDALVMMRTDLDHTLGCLTALAQQHAGLVMRSRSHADARAVTSFGLLCGQWALALARSRRRLHLLAAEALCVRLGGETQTVVQQVAQALQLKAPPASAPGLLDEWAALVCELGVLCACHGKVAADIAQLLLPEIGELEAKPQPALRAGVAPSPQPQLACEVIAVAAQRAAARVAVVLAALAQASTGAGFWPAGVADRVALLATAHSSTRSMAELLPSLQAKPERMRSHLGAEGVGSAEREQLTDAVNQSLEQLELFVQTTPALRINPTSPSPNPPEVHLLALA